MSTEYQGEYGRWSELKAVEQGFNELVSIATSYNTELSIEKNDVGRGAVNPFKEALKDQICVVQEIIEECCEAFSSAYLRILSETIDISVHDIEDDMAKRSGVVDLDLLGSNKKRIAFIISRMHEEDELPYGEPFNSKKLQRLKTAGVNPFTFSSESLETLTRLRNQNNQDFFSERETKQFLRQHDFSVHTQSLGSAVEGYAIQMEGQTQIYVPEVGFDGQYEHAERIINQLIQNVQKKTSSQSSILIEVPVFERAFIDFLIRRRNFVEQSIVSLQGDERLVLQHIAANKR